MKKRFELNFKFEATFIHILNINRTLLIKILYIFLFYLSVLDNLDKVYLILNNYSCDSILYIFRSANYSVTF